MGSCFVSINAINMRLAGTKFFTYFSHTLPNIKRIEGELHDVALL